jgi:tetratricopeptide (TPR) repeat protein
LEYLNDELQAITWYEKAIAAFHHIGYPNCESRAYCNLGNVKMRLRDPSAMEEFEKSIALNPKNGTVYMNIGFTYYMISDPGDPRHEWALDALANAILADPVTYRPIVLSRLRSVGYTWKEDMQKIEERIAKKAYRF